MYIYVYIYIFSSGAIIGSSFWEFSPSFNDAAQWAEPQRDGGMANPVLWRHHESHGFHAFLAMSGHCQTPPRFPWGLSTQTQISNGSIDSMIYPHCLYSLCTFLYVPPKKTQNEGEQKPQPQLRWLNGWGGCQRVAIGDGQAQSHQRRVARFTLTSASPSWGVASLHGREQGFKKN